MEGGLKLVLHVSPIPYLQEVKVWRVKGSKTRMFLERTVSMSCVPCISPSPHTASGEEDTSLKSLSVKTNEGV